MKEKSELYDSIIKKVEEQIKREALVLGGKQNKNLK